MDEIFLPNGDAASVPLLRKMTQLGESSASHWLILALSSLAAVLIIQPVAPFRILGIIIVFGLAIIASVAPWLGIVALFPLAFSVATPPDGIGAKEAVFALLTLSIIPSSILKCILRTGVRDVIRSYGLPMVCGAVLLCVNLLGAIRHDVSFTDWLRGAAPFAYVFMAAPIAIELREDPERVKWLGIAVIAASMLFCAYILGYYASHRLWEYRWYQAIDGKSVRVSEAFARAHAATVTGPFVERITTLVPSSTDALIPLTLTTGFVLATLAAGSRLRAFGIAMMALALPTILVTYTRSMLLSPLLVIACICLYLVIRRRDRVKHAVVLLPAFSLYAMVVIAGLGLELAWLNRGALLFEALKQQGLKVANVVAGLGLALSHALTPTVHPTLANAVPATASAAPSALASVTSPPLASAAAPTVTSAATSAPAGGAAPTHASAQTPTVTHATTSAPANKAATIQASATTPTATRATTSVPPKKAATIQANATAPTVTSAATPSSTSTAAPTSTAAVPPVKSVQSSAKDDNVATRVDEYRVAWKMFLDHPAIGNGLGAKHPMAFVRSTDDILNENVAYIHNWPLYMLMAGGLLGFAAYTFLLFRPIACRYVTPRLAGSSGLALRAGLCTLAIYALFFAVVRLITFNLIVAAAWGVFLAFGRHRSSIERATLILTGRTNSRGQARSSRSMAFDCVSGEEQGEQITT